MNRLEIFPDEILQYVARAIADWKSGSGITELFRIAGYPHVRHDGSTKWRFVYARLQELNSGRDGQYHVAKIIQKLADPKQHIGAEDFRVKLITSLNEALIHVHIQLNSDGRLVLRDHPLKFEAPEANAAASDNGDDVRNACRSIPADIKRDLLVEAGHRCAIFTCHTVTPLEAHHILPWSEHKRHDPDHMIVLCSNCHGRAHKGEIDRKSLYTYKERLRSLRSGAPSYPPEEVLEKRPASVIQEEADWSEDRCRPRFDVIVDGVTRLETEFAPHFKVRQFSGDAVRDLHWRIRGQRFSMEWRPASGAALDRTNFVNTFDLSQAARPDEAVDLDEMGFEIRFYWRGRNRTELHRWPIARRELPQKVLWDVGEKVLPPAERDEVGSP